MATQDLTTYTGTYGTKLTVTSTTLTAVAYTRGTDEWVTKDYGADYFDALDIDFCMRPNSAGTVNGIGGDTNLTGAQLSDVSSLTSTDMTLHSATESAWGGHRFSLWRGYAAALDQTANVARDTDYYMTWSRPAGSDVVTCYIYSDSGRTTLVDTLSVSGFGTTKWRWHQAMTHDYNAGSAETWAGTVSNVDFNLSAPETTQPRMARSEHFRRRLFGPKVF